MNKKYRILLLLACVMLGICASGIAEGLETTPEHVEETSAPEAMEVPVELPVIKAEMEAPSSTAEPVEATVSPMPEAAHSVIPDEISEISGVPSGNNYNSGYARLISSATGYASAAPDAQAVIYLENGVFYVSARRASSGGDRLHVHFVNANETCSAWVDEFCLSPLDAGEVLDFVSSRLGGEDVHLYGDDSMLPLDAPACGSVITYSKPEQKQETDIPAMFVNQTRISMEVGDTQSIGVSFSDGKGHGVGFVSEDTSIADISDDGRVTGISAGTTHVQIRSEFSNVAVIEIRVQE